ncbi:glycosyltransferase family 4 protein [Tenuifilum thalassicum]|uniref:Glycosyltransferase family 4 protein n=1 Tax=Tenuifilum thalassicum TaxID=2590900 RepID=A0A7D3XEH3_9BACT|nr:glycosyltransferase family 4 protein [Tenuifilum thalassicum]QKG80232.1 glycosyltransferase family 4 protein [Tenuifilum thalassicum]
MKTFIAYNTIDFNSIPDIKLNNDEIKKKYKITYEKVVLFTGRIQERKRLDILLDIFSNLITDESIGLVIVGPGMNESFLKIINNSKNIIYLGEIYDIYQINEIYKCSDIFCIPGTNGLGINHALYWGLPVITLKTVWHNPEIFYLKNGVNGYLVNDKYELKDKICYLFKNPDELNKMKRNAKKIIIREANVEKMFMGFYQAINYLEKNKL